jgi:sugar phosphate isomerase/epimerase
MVVSNRFNRRQPFGPDIPSSFRADIREEKAMKTIKGPALFLAQFAGDEAPFNSWDEITEMGRRLRLCGVQVPSWDGRLIDLEKAAASKDYCDEFKGVAAENGIAVTELSTHLQGQLVAVHPAYDEAFDGFAAPEVRGNPTARQEWAVKQVMLALDRLAQHGHRRGMASFSGALAWPYIYPWPQRPAGLIETAFDELAKRWRPILDHADACGVDICYEIHPGEDLHDGATFEMFLERLGGHPAATCSTIRRITCCSVSTISTTSTSTTSASRCFTSRTPSSIRPGGRASIPATRAGSTGPGGSARSATGRSISRAFSPSSAIDFDGWAVVEWECCLKHPEDGAREGAQFVRDHIIRVTDKAFDDFAGAGTDDAANRRMLGIG